jgi:hypothetical protein
MVWHFYGKTKTATISSQNQFRPQIWAQIVAGVETHSYSPSLGPGDLFFFEKLWGKPGSEFFAMGIYHTIKKKERAKSTFVPGFSILPNEQYNFDNFPSVPSCDTLKLDRTRRVMQYISNLMRFPVVVCTRVTNTKINISTRVPGYRSGAGRRAKVIVRDTVRLCAQANFLILHSKSAGE